MKGEEWGEDKELAEKKKAAAARVAALKEKSLLRKAARQSALNDSGPKVNAISLMPKTENAGINIPAENDKIKPESVKPKQKQKNNAKNKKRFKPRRKQQAADE